MVAWRSPLLSLSKKVTTPEKFSKKWKKKKIKELYIELEKIIRSKDDMPVDFETDLVPEKQTTESEVDANDSPKRTCGRRKQ